MNCLKFKLALSMLKLEVGNYSDYIFPFQSFLLIPKIYNILDNDLKVFCQLFWNLEPIDEVSF